MKIPTQNRGVKLHYAGDHWRGEFRAMASPCEVLIRVPQKKKAKHVAMIAAREAWRIEDKFSRYLAGNIVDRINCSDGGPVIVDEETANLLAFADSLYSMSEGRFDITSGSLREAWTFDGSDRIPSSANIQKALGKVGWSRVRWVPPTIQLKQDMQIDFGGIGKEYAVDRAAALVAEAVGDSVLVNFGGDLVVLGSGAGPGWRVGVEKPDSPSTAPERVIRLKQGGLATSGDARRFLLKDGVRYGHVLDCRTGWPVEGAPRSVTVAADTCTQAGMLATLAVLRGREAEEFLDQQGVQYWCLR